jgi:hypothetical protein
MGSSPNSTDFFKMTLINLIIGLLKNQWNWDLPPDLKCYNAFTMI